MIGSRDPAGRRVHQKFSLAINHDDGANWRLQGAKRPKPADGTRTEHMATLNERSDRVSSGFIEFMNSLAPEERRELTEALREPNTFLAEDMQDVLAILKQLQE